MRNTQLRNPEQGTGLIEVLLVLAILGIIGAALIPNAFKLAAIKSEIDASAALAAINLSESQFATRYGAFVTPVALSNFNLTFPSACSNAELLAGELSVAPPNYSMVFTPGMPATGTAFACAPTGSAVPPIGYQSFSIELSPVNHLGRYFFSCVGNSCTNSAHSGLIEFADGRPATESDPQFNVSAAGSTSAGSSGTSGTGSSAPLAFQGAWTQGATYQPGQIVTYQTSPGSSSAIFLNVTGLNPVAPSQDGVNWSQIGTAQALQVTYASGSFTPGPTLTTNDFWACQLVGPCLSSSGGPSWSSVIGITGTPNPATISAPIFSFSVSNALPGNGAINIVVFQSGNTNQISSACYLPGAGSGVNNGTSAVNPNGNGPCTLSAVVPGEQIVVGFENTGIGGISSYNPGIISWAIQTVQ